MAWRLTSRPWLRRLRARRVRFILFAACLLGLRMWSQGPLPIPSLYRHPIDTLIKAGNNQFESLLSSQTYDLKSSAAEYRRQRGRHPPPGFDVWFKFAQEREAIVVESFWDQIYHDLNPLWALSASQLRKDVAAYKRISNESIHVRNGKASTSSTHFWQGHFKRMVQSIAHLLPDMDIPFNELDEPRLVVPHEQMVKYMELARQSRSIPPVPRVKQEFTENVDLDTPAKEDITWEDTKPYWKMAIRGCPAESPSAIADITTDFSYTPLFSMDNMLAHTYQGYVFNYTKSTDICHQPDLLSLHGGLLYPLNVRCSGHLFPLFGSTKLSVNNDILWPPAMYWEGHEEFTGGSDQNLWQAKKSEVIWRGTASGGIAIGNVWKRFHRHRFVAMVNATQVQQAEEGQNPTNWALPPSLYHIKAAKANQLSLWVKSWSDVGFVRWHCSSNKQEDPCQYFHSVSRVPMSEQFQYKFLPDIDGYSFSGRYLGFLKSNSLPIKATIYREWHDSRLIAWKHFVPMDNRFLDFFGILEYFFEHDLEAERIALEGRRWAELVLRRDDMQIYLLRLLLEYRRVIDDAREMLGFVGDLN